MNETSFRVANFLKMSSMFIVLGSLIYFYAYADNIVSFMTAADNWYQELSKTIVFYSGLAIFAVFNLIMGIALSTYKNVKGYDEKTLLFKNEQQKERVHLWMIYLNAGINFLVTCVVMYLALVRINETKSETDYIYVPILGLIVIVVIIIGLFRAMIKK